MTKENKLKIFLGFSFSVIVLLTIATGVHLIEFHFGSKISQNSFSAIDTPTAADSKVHTLGDVPLFELPWKRGAKTDLAKAEPSDAAAESNIQNEITAPSTSGFPVPRTVAVASLPRSKGMAALPFGSSGTKVQSPLFGKTAAPLAKAFVPVAAQRNPVAGLIPPLQDTKNWDAEKLLAYYFHQICNGRTPTVKDWRTLAQSKPPGTEAYLNLPFDAGHFIVSVCTDAWGRLWIGTEGGGVWGYDPQAVLDEQWHHFTSDDGLGDDYVYALAVDRLGRVWAGHLNHGVSVYNGQNWQNYGVVGNGKHCLSGPIGERVFSIKTCPTDGDVWIATNAGLTRYSQSNDRWSYYTRAEGLPSDNVNAIAFDIAGNLYVGTQCDGIGISQASDSYAHWQQVKGPDGLPTAAAGAGLPTSFVNDVLVSREGTLYAGTTTGLAWSKDGGRTWQFCRGADWAAKVRGMADGAPTGWTETISGALAEDYITSLAEDSDGKLYIGYRMHGCARMGKGDGELHIEGTYLEPYYVTCITTGSAEAVVGTYDGGIQVIDSVRPAQRNQLALHISKPTRLPSGAATPDLAEFNRELQTIADVPPGEPSHQARVVALADDWLTQGGWLGRYGRFWSLLAAVDDPKRGYEWGAGPTSLEWKIDLGGLHRPTDYLRYWIGKFYTTDHRALEIPPVYMDSRVDHHLTTWEKNRRQAEWDDHGETYSATAAGPTIDLHVTIPSGIYWLSLYEVNDDAHNNVRNARRDFRVIVTEGSGAMEGHREDPAKTVLASSRVQNFWGGVYKRFLVQGPIALAIGIDRHYSFNTVFNALMVDLPDERPVGYFLSVDEWRSEKGHRQAAIAAQVEKWKRQEANVPRFESSGDEFLAAEQLVHRLQTMEYWNAEWWAIHQRRIAVGLARWAEISTCAKAASEGTALQATSFYQAGMYEQWEEAQNMMHLTTAREIERSLRWDGLTSDSRGRGYLTIREYLALGAATQ